MASSAKPIVCTACSKKITPKANPGISCGGCGKAQHFTCLNLTAGKKESYLKGIDNYLCTQCKAKHRRSLSFTATTPLNVPDPTTQPSRTSQSPIAQSNQSQPPSGTSDLIPTLIDLVNTLQRTVSSLELKLTEALKEIAVLRTSKDNPDNTHKRGKVTQSTSRGRRSYTINGVVCVEGENTDEIAEKTLKYFDSDFTIDKTVTTRRLPAKTASLTPTILITVPTDHVKAVETLKKANRRSVLGKDINLPASDKIHINEAHEQRTYKLFREARKLKTKGYRFIWIQENRVLIKKAEGEKIIHLKDTDQLNKFFEAEPVATTIPINTA